jgi:hypothetical protein
MIQVFKGFPPLKLDKESEKPLALSISASVKGLLGSIVPQTLVFAALSRTLMDSRRTRVGAKSTFLM